MLIFFILVSGIIYQVTGIGNRLIAGLTLDDTAAADVGKLVQFFFSVLVFGFTGYLYARFTFRDTPGYHLGLRPAARNIFYLLAILLLLFSFPLEEWLGELNKHIPLWHWMVRSEQENDRQVEAFLKVHHSFDPVINVVVMAAVPAFCEEICFRGALQRIMIQICRRPLAGILITSFLFAFFHFQFEGFLPRMFLAVLLGAAYWYSGSLWVAIVAHFVFNASQIIVAMYAPGFMAKNPSIPWLIVLQSLVIVVGLLSAMRNRSTATFSGVYES
ncbi:MAG TPA: CPBP family intramembrane glutamic endopeptidase [Puia sp.]|nr:CPBP family intramembrane glutamic endopeptidase [Puia sp.]